MPIEEEIPTTALATWAFEPTNEGFSGARSIPLPIARLKGEDACLRSFQRSFNKSSPDELCRTAVTQGIKLDGLILSSSVLRAFSREDLTRADVLGQVDRKFVACLVWPSTNTGHASPPGSAELPNSERAEGESIMILIDQHAADERIRVERFLRCICEEFINDRVERRILGPSAPWSTSPHEIAPSQGGSDGTKILLTTSEAQALLGPRSGEVRGAFARWGFTFGDLATTLQELENEPELPPYTQVDVYSVPDIIADKVRFYIASPLFDTLHVVPHLYL